MYMIRKIIPFTNRLAKCEVPGSHFVKPTPNHPNNSTNKTTTKKFKIHWSGLAWARFIGPWKSLLSHSLVTGPIREHGWRHTEPCPPRQLHPAAPCQQVNGGRFTTWHWSRQQNNCLSTRHPIIRLLRLNIPAFSCSDEPVRRRKAKGLVHVSSLRVEMTGDGRRGDK